MIPRTKLVFNGLSASHYTRTEHQAHIDRKAMKMMLQTLCNIRCTRSDREWNEQWPETYEEMNKVIEFAEKALGHQYHGVPIAECEYCMTDDDSFLLET